ncbi:hypothetical protein DFH08DRAFT_1071450 [Mycena albidolilacea]|uniref:F-box domain-containing protein n=1 Tax=Mycena albidolilacea TaxID=1033008 RepID=A0AAD7AVJ6_9AGAR|nr:hypothetical protein DFH08DRAFT_1071450 [Mycena albidolilacea]
MTNLRARLAELDVEIVEQERILYQLKQNRIALQRELNATVFPVATLPLEIVAEIFLHYTPHFHKPYAPVFYPSAPSVAITGVCRAWRDIALATPSLWSTLDVDFDLIPPHVVSVPGLVEGFIYRWLDRTGTCPLSLVFDAPARGHGSGRLMRYQEPFPLSRLRSVIHRYSDQVHSLEVDICGRDIRALGLDWAEFPLLRRATLFCDHNRDSTLSLPGCVFGNAPRIHHLTLRSSGIPTFPLPWPRLTEFEGPISDLQLFVLAPNLTRVTCSHAAGDIESATVISHPNLVSFTGAHSDMIRYLTLPALQYLGLYPTTNSLVPFLKRSSPPLLSLSVPGYSFAEWYPSMHLIGRTLQILTIYHPSADIMSHICRLHTPFHALPNLRSLTLSRVAGGVDLSFFVRFLYSRLDKPLHTFRLTWESSPFLDGKYRTNPDDERTGDTISGHLAALSRVGMNIYLGTNEKNYASPNVLCIPKHLHATDAF